MVRPERRSATPHHVIVEVVPILAAQQQRFNQPRHSRLALRLVELHCWCCHPQRQRQPIARRRVGRARVHDRLIEKDDLTRLQLELHALARINDVRRQRLAKCSWRCERCVVVVAPGCMRAGQYLRSDNLYSASIRQFER